MSKNIKFRIQSCGLQRKDQNIPKNIIYKCSSDQQQSNYTRNCTYQKKQIYSQLNSSSSDLDDYKNENIQQIDVDAILPSMSSQISEKLYNTTRNSKNQSPISNNNQINMNQIYAQQQQQMNQSKKSFIQKIQDTQKQNNIILQNIEQQTQNNNQSGILLSPLKKKQKKYLQVSKKKSNITSIVAQNNFCKSNNNINEQKKIQLTRNISQLESESENEKTTRTNIKYTDQLDYCPEQSKLFNTPQHFTSQNTLLTSNTKQFQQNMENIIDNSKQQQQLILQQQVTQKLSGISTKQIKQKQTKKKVQRFQSPEKKNQKKKNNSIFQKHNKPQSIHQNQSNNNTFIQEQQKQKQSEEKINTDPKNHTAYGKFSITTNQTSNNKKIIIDYKSQEEKDEEKFSQENGVYFNTFQKSEFYNPPKKTYTQCENQESELKLIKSQKLVRKYKYPPRIINKNAQEEAFCPELSIFEIFKLEKIIDITEENIDEQLKNNQQQDNSENSQQNSQNDLDNLSQNQEQQCKIKSAQNLQSFDDIEIKKQSLKIIKNNKIQDIHKIGKNYQVYSSINNNNHKKIQDSTNKSNTNSTQNSDNNDSIENQQIDNQYQTNEIIV